MGKELKKKDKKDKKLRRINKTDKKKSLNYWISITLLVIMVLSIAGFALSGSFSTTNKKNLPNNLPLQEFQDKKTGKIFWGAIKNGEEFIFLNISGYQNNTYLYKISNRIKNSSSLYVYYDKDFNSPESKFLLNRVFKSLEIKPFFIDKKICSNNTLLIVYNETKVLNVSNQGDCMILKVKKNNEYRTIENLVYFLIQ